MAECKLTPDDLLRKYREGIKRFQEETKGLSTEQKLSVVQFMGMGYSRKEAIKKVKGGKP